MDALILIGIAAGVLVAQWTVSTVLLWLFARLLKLPKARLGRSMLVCFIWLVVAVAIYASGIVLPAFVRVSDTGLLFGLLGMIVNIIILGKLLGGSAGRVLATWFLTAAAATAILIGPALWVRATVVESFNISAGSMAPTLMGSHHDVVCNACGWRFATRPVDHGPVGGQPDRIQTTCLNCGLSQEFSGRRLKRGDTLLALKTRKPRRWELAIYRNPMDTAITYVHRLVGLPGETIEIAGGDVFVNGRRAFKPNGEFPDTWLPVHDTKFAPNARQYSWPDWVADGQGATLQAGAWMMDAREGKQVAVRFDRTILDTLSHNNESEVDDYSGSPFGMPRFVGDVRVECELADFGGDGEIVCEWSHAGRGYRAHFGAKGLSGLDELEGEKQAAVHSYDPPVGRPLAQTGRITFAFRDGRAVLSTASGDVEWFLDEPVGPEDVDWARAQEEKPPAESVKLRIVARDCRFRITRLRVWRDIYYRSDSRFKRGELSGCAGQPITLAGNEYFVLGDNSARSSDSRIWVRLDRSLEGRCQLGTVPAECMIGVAKLIYEPPGRMHWFKSAE